MEVKPCRRSEDTRCFPFTLLATLSLLCGENLSHVHRSLFELSATRKSSFPWIGFVTFSPSSILISVFFFDISQNPTECIQICSGAVHPLAHPPFWATGLLQIE